VSWKHFQWALKQRTGCDRANHVLIRLAYMANRNGAVVVSISDLSHMLDMPERTLKRATAKLAKDKLIERERKVNSRGHRVTTKYVLLWANVACRRRKPRGQNVCLGLEANVAPPLTSKVYSTRELDTFIETYPLGDTSKVVGGGGSASVGHCTPGGRPQ